MLRIGWSSLLLCNIIALGQTMKAVSIGNRHIVARVEVTSQHLLISSIEGAAERQKISPIDAFVIVMRDDRIVRSSEMTLQSGLKRSRIPAISSSSRAAARIAGEQLCANLEDVPLGLQAHWCAVVRGELPYLRQEITFQATARSLDIAEVQLFRFQDSKAKVVGSVPGSPLVAGAFFFGFESPLSYASVVDHEVIAALKRTLPLQQNQSVTYSSVVGIAQPRQLRRDFLAYIEMERAHPYRTFLHYNTWFDLGFGERIDEAGVLNRMQAYGRELVQKRKVKMDSFLMDDGWDDTSSLWNFNRGFPDGFTPLKKEASKYGFGIGVWLSPWGGYSKEKQQRIAYGRSQGYEIVKGGYALSGPKYYARFEQTCLNFIKKYGVNQFKFDGTGNADQVIPGSAFDSDFSAAIHLIDRLRQESPQIFINLTYGTKASPFWLLYADTIWRNGKDTSFAGEGSWRQKWITYRDAMTYENVVEASPLFPLNSLMLHGMVFATHAEHLSEDPSNDFPSEIRTYFGSGTELQEMYITPSLMTQANWDILAEAARWSRANADILKDTHWIGGDPAKGEVYGWASWNENNGIIMLRNPSSREQQIEIDVQNAFELPQGADRDYQMQSPWRQGRNNKVIELLAGTPYVFHLKPFQVLTLQSIKSH